MPTVVTSARDFRDMAIEALADSEALLLERVGELEADVRSYRELAVAGFDALATLTRQHDQLYEDCRQLREEYRRLREELLLKAGADDERSGPV
jgi:hypothetical protein